MYEIASQSFFVLTTASDDKTAPILQKVLWAPSAAAAPKVTTNSKYNNDDNKNRNASNITSSNSSSVKTSRQAIAFVYNNDVYYKPKIQGDVINRITRNGKCLFLFKPQLNGMYDDKNLFP